MKDRCQELEEQIGRVEAAVGQCEAALQNFVSTEETVRLTQELKDRRAQLESLLPEWERLAETLQES
jgi:regulator of replication initiation timing